MLCPKTVSRGYWSASLLKTGANALRLIAQTLCNGSDNYTSREATKCDSHGRKSVVHGDA